MYNVQENGRKSENDKIYQHLKNDFMKILYVIS